jgi:iron(III) transport system ATP-binding protein
VALRVGAEQHIAPTTLVLAPRGFNTLLGETLAGKTTLLRLMAGLVRPTAGRLLDEGRDVTGMAVQQRRVAMVYQQFINYPNLSVAENIASPLRVTGTPEPEVRKRVGAVADLLRLSPLLQRRPAELSGGQQQRCAIARALVKDAGLVLLDEPLANLDAHLRVSMEEEFAAFHRRTGTTMIYITHDQAEAMALADRVAVMDKGRILQAASPSVLYREPADETVARFIGAGMILPCTVSGETVTVFDKPANIRRPPRAHASGVGKLCVRAHDIAFAEVGIPGRVERLVYRGGGYLADVVVDGLGAPLRVETLEPAPVAAGQTVHVAIRDGWLLPG